MSAAELREALDKGLRYPTDMALIEDAARTIALPILEADPELVERIANCLRNYVVQVDTDRAWILFARAVLAAISPPTPPQTFTASDCPENYWSPELGPCICRGKVHGPAISTPTPGGQE